MEYYEAPPNPLTLGLDGAALATLWGLLALSVAAPIAYVAARTILTRCTAPRTDRPRRLSRARVAIATAAALGLASVTGWLLLAAALNAPVASADTTAKASDHGLQRDTIAVNHAVSEAFPRIEHIAGFRPDPLGEHEQGRALDILIPGDPTLPENIVLGDDIRDFLLDHAAELGVVHVVWRQNLYRADGTSEPMEPRGSDVFDHLTHLHVTTTGGGFP